MINGVRSSIITGIVVIISNRGAVAASLDPTVLNMPQQQVTQSGPPVPLSAVFNESLLNSPRASNLRAQLRISRAAYAQALTLPNPSFFFLDDTAQRARQVGASIPIEAPWKLAFRVLLAKAQVKLTDLEIQTNLWQFRATTRKAYLDVVIARESAETLMELQQLSGELLSIAKRRFDADDVAAYDVERASLANLQADADYRQAVKKVDQTSQRLTVFIGRDYKQTVTVQRLPSFALKAEANELLPDVSKNLPSLDQMIAEALRTRLDLKSIEQKLAVNRAGMRSTVANIVPNTQLNVGSSYSGNPPDGPATRGYFLGVTQEVPILNFQQGELARLKAIGAQLKMEVQATRNVVTEDVINAYHQLDAARERVIIFQTQILPTSDKVARMARRGYEVGQTDITATLAAQQSNVQTRLAYLEAVRAYQLALTDLEQAVGHPF